MVYPEYDQESQQTGMLIVGSLSAVATFKTRLQQVVGCIVANFGRIVRFGLKASNLA